MKEHPAGQKNLFSITAKSENTRSSVALPQIPPSFLSTRVFFYFEQIYKESDWQVFNAVQTSSCTREQYVPLCLPKSLGVLQPVPNTRPVCSDTFVSICI